MYNDVKSYNKVKWQIDCDNAIKEKNNVILSSPTGSGKTQRYEIWALNKPERPIFITSPIKALSNQKFRELRAAGYNVGLETGDIRYIPSEKCDIICCTQEIYNNKYRECKNSTLIIDEFSYIFEDSERARVYIDSLYYSEAKNIMLCSATFGNPQELKEYINKLTDREFFLYENKDRLTTLEYKGELSKENIKDSFVVCYSQRTCRKIAKIIYEDRINKIQDMMEKISRNYCDPRTRHKKEILQLANKYSINNKELIELATIGVVYYYGNLYPKEKLFVEELFERRLIDTVVGTDALALGVNFPIKNVVFAELQKNRNHKVVDISRNLFEQLSGRAGRKGYFDNGYVYYCKDLSKTYNNIKNESDVKSLEELFYKLVYSKNENVKIILSANIKDILMGETTIEDEALFITQYSTDDKNIIEEKQKISEIIDYITSFDIALYFLKYKFPNFKFEEGYNKALENCKPKVREKINKISYSLTLLQPYFDKDIGIAYLTEYSPEQNCRIFVDILMELPIEELMGKYCKSFYDMLLFKKYMNSLPKKYSKNYNLDLIDEIIDSMDYTALHPDSFKINKIINVEKKQSNLRKKKEKKIVYKCPSYLDIISADGLEYVKILIENRKILICDYSDSDVLNAYFIPSDTIYKVSGILTPKQCLSVLNRINLSSLVSEEEVSDKVKMMKLSLEDKLKL